MSDDGVSLYRLWVRKGEPFQLSFSSNPSVDHDGGNTVTHLVLTHKAARDLQKVIESHGCEIDLIPAHRQTPEQEKERQTLLGMQRGDRVWPSGRCPECSWFDPLLEGDPCGILGWDVSTVTMFQASSKPQEDKAKCPVPHLWSNPQ